MTQSCGLHIAKGGRLIFTEYSPEEQAWVDNDITEDASNCLEIYCTLEEGLLLRDIVNLCEKNRDSFRLFLDKYNFDEYLDEAKQSHLKLVNKDNLIFRELILRISGDAHWDSKNKCYHISDNYDSYIVAEIPDDKVFALNTGTQIKELINIHPGSSSFDECINLPLYISKNYEISTEDEIEKFYIRLQNDKFFIRMFYKLLNKLNLVPKRKVLLVANKDMTLGMILHTLFESFSLFGNPEERNEQLAEFEKEFDSKENDKIRPIIIDELLNSVE